MLALVHYPPHEPPAAMVAKSDALVWDRRVAIPLSELRPHRQLDNDERETPPASGVHRPETVAPPRGVSQLTIRPRLRAPVAIPSLMPQIDGCYGLGCSIEKRQKWAVLGGHGRHGAG